MSSEKPKIESLLKLLNDEDDIAGAAMIQLLKHYQNELDSILKVLQECDIVLLRKRSHHFDKHFDHKGIHTLELISIHAALHGEDGKVHFPRRSYLA